MTNISNYDDCHEKWIASKELWINESRHLMLNRLARLDLNKADHPEVFEAAERLRAQFADGLGI